MIHGRAYGQSVFAASGIGMASADRVQTQMPLLGRNDFPLRTPITARENRLQPEQQGRSEPAAVSVAVPALTVTFHLPFIVIFIYIWGCILCAEHRVV